jgi:AcrR family transcriptional regulator
MAADAQAVNIGNSTVSNARSISLCQEKNCSLRTIDLHFEPRLRLKNRKKHLIAGRLSIKLSVCRTAKIKETGPYQMATKQDEEVTRAKILEMIDRLFYRQGIRAVGVDTIVAELGISKKTLYRHFRSKSEMIEAYLRGRFRPLPEDSDKPPAEQILSNFAWLDRSLSSKREYRGCAYLNALAELGEDERESRDLAAHFKESRRLWFRHLLSKLDVDDPDTLATQLSLLVDGAYSAMLTRKDPSSTRAAIAAARVLLKNAGVSLAYAAPIGSLMEPAADEVASRISQRRQRN